MSEAEAPNLMSPAESASLHRSEAIAPLQVVPEPESDWTTVHFPNAFDVDELVRRESIDRITIVEQHNQALHDRILYLEVALYEAQDTHQQAMQRWETAIHQSTATLAEPQPAPATADPQVMAKHLQDLTAAQAQTAKLFQELAMAHQVAHRQQVLVETLTEQLKLARSGLPS